MKKLCHWILYRLMGWQKDISQEHPDKYIICLAPHTSNWDFIIGQLFAISEHMRINFLMKKEWFFWPLGILFRKMGGIPVYRKKSMSMTDALAQAADSADRFGLCVTPEGTRSAVREWKKGFYYIALKAKLPILLYGIDYRKKVIRCTKTIIPSGDIEKDMKDIKSYYTAFEGRHPEKFLV
ncbi:MAG: 1-acyl-sn-glycerol-3-phosphate acyltransferase [Bacteroidales bacterium]|nr:1-acyl-sn-glycerol-3-phosphate acyltransferase [Bacteroidales bacterium]MCM1147383.1 1-acyl-sn-glycerol-3-phosphate acyltransferase [Bacteroidales bacterium]MCM1207182.1 1-acyl-sn-glycerol-3-phosphate acyltransferase [Bacillota bacterium]MCM1510415.1 1-acyl-sn-glycerol-3-phosphate acyltransferase [Clostridium sp.]